MKLTDLNPEFYDVSGERKGIGITFNCPCGCGGFCALPFRNPLDGGEMINDNRPSWQRTGETFENITLTPSIQRTGGCKWHGHLTNGVFKRC